MSVSRQNMKDYFEDEAELQRPARRDTEVTLGTGMLVAIPLGLFLLCAVCFGLGYMAGHRTTGPSAASKPSTPTPAPDQEPLQASGAIPKPSAAAGAPVPDASPSNAGASSSGDDASAANPAMATSGASAPASPVATAPSAQPAVHSALTSNAGPVPQAGGNPAVHAALPPSQTFMVQIAAVSNLEDANVLTNALRSRGYAVNEKRDSADGLIHVRIGPFMGREEANHWRDKLLGDGYNALVQP